jgi:hypothetical protein
MAYFIFNNQNNLVKIALNDADKNSLNIDSYTVEDVSTSDANSVMFNQSTVSYDGNTVILTPIDRSVKPGSMNTDTTTIYPDSTSLEKYLDNCVIPALKDFVSNQTSNSMYTSINNYLTYLKSLDYSTVTYPIEYSWEKYCNDNSITFFHPLQIP